MRTEPGRATREPFGELLDDIPAMFFVTDAEGEIIALNRFGAECLGFEVEALRGRNHCDLIVPADRERCRAQLQLWARTPGEVFRWETRKVRRDGGIIWVRELARPVIQSDGELVFLLVCDDITETRRIEDELRESEERYRLLVDLIPQHVWTTDADGQHTYFSRRWYDYTGARPEETEGEGWATLLHPADRAHTLERWQHSLATGDRYEVQYRFRSAVGEYHWFLGQAFPQRDDDGRIFRWIGTLTDIEDQRRISAEREELLRREQTARAAAERAAREEQALREAVETVSTQTTSDRMMRQIARSAITATGASGAMVAWMDADRDQVRVVAEAGSLPPHPQTFPYTESFTRRVVELRTARLIERLGSADDGPIWARGSTAHEDWSMLVVPLIGDVEPFGALFISRAPERKQFSDGEIARARTFGNIVTLAFRKLVLLEDSERRRQEMERITESRSRLMRGFSHDLKNPLGAADGHARLLEDGILGELTPRQMDSVRRIRRSIGTSLRLIQDLLELARAEAGQIDLSSGPTDLAAVTREIVGDYRAQAVAEGLELSARIPEELVVETDASRVRQVLGNLLSNAVKHTGRSSVTVELERTGNRQGSPAGEWIGIHVIDTGPGIAPELQEQIFFEFTRLDSKAPHGAGIGLAISRRIARLLGGDLTLESEPGRGSRFTLWLPRV